MPWSMVARMSSLTRRMQSKHRSPLPACAPPPHTRHMCAHLPSRVCLLRGMGDDEAFFAAHAEDIEAKLRQAKALREELTRAERQRDELSRQVSHLEREAVVSADEMEKANDDLAGVQAERDLLERKVNERTRRALAATPHAHTHGAMRSPSACAPFL